MKTPSITLLADANIPLVHEFFGPHARILEKAGADISQQDCLKSDLLLTRTITRVDESLLKNSPIKFIGSATAGLEHIDTDYLKKADIKLAHAKGANATSVAQYVTSCLAHFHQQNTFAQTTKKRAGVVGVGCCGSKVAKNLANLGFEVLCNDPPRREQDPTFHSTPLEAFSDLDVICLHTPLTQSDPHPTYHLIDHAFLARQKPGCILINAGRGAVIDDQALLKAKHIRACLDVWDNEPRISLELLKHATLATPHIAGYSQQAKARATFMIYEQACQFFGWTARSAPLTQTPCDTQPWDIRALNALDPLEATNKMRHALLSLPADQHRSSTIFEALRKTYLSRQEYAEEKIS